MNDEYNIDSRDFIRRKLSSILPVLARAEAGDLSGLIELTEDNEKDEFRELIIKLNSLLSITKNQLEELKELNDSLERKVEARTAELIEKNILLRNQTDQYMTLLNAQSEMGEGVAITELGRFIYVNEALCRIYGYSREELMNMNSFFDIVEPAAKEELLKRYRHRMEGSPASDSGETVIIRKDGSKIFIEYSLKPMKMDGQDQLISIVHDITQKKQTEELIRKERERSGKAEMARAVSEKFLANISHEIRTPMNAIVGFAKLLSDFPLNAEQKKYAEIIRHSGENLLVIINDILDLSRLREGKIILEHNIFSVPELVATSLQMISASAKQKKIKLSSMIDPRLEMKFAGDPVRLGQILLNLLSNAVKFTDSGEIAVSCALLDEKEKYAEVGFTVSDTGRGIAMEELPYIFDRFGKTEHSNWKEHEGTGIGLAISRHLVELMGGEITVQSELNSGTSFHYTLSFRKVGAEFADALSTNSGSADDEIESTPARILLVEDNEMNRELLRILCMRWNYDLELAEDGEIAMQKLASIDYDLILMDLKLPGISGYEVTERLRKMKRSAKTPVIAVTAHAIEGEREKCLAIGMNDYVSKPIEPTLLHTKIEEQLARVRLSPTGKKTNVTDLRYLVQITLGNEAQQQKIIGLFIQQAPAMIAVMKLNLKNEARAELARTIHKFRSGAGNVFAPASARFLASLERKCISGSKKTLSDGIKKLELMTETAIEELTLKLKK